ncbi:hypothetical protein C0J52_22318 [Blattella germanica]|nr:hypothetical protein C0J52_22318 [Blattella germanica]
MRRLLDFQNNQNENSTRDAVVKEESEDCDTISGDVDISNAIESCIIIKPEIPSADLLNISTKKDSTVKEDPINEQESKTMKIRNIPKKRKSVTEDKVEELDDENASLHSDTSLFQELGENKSKGNLKRTTASNVRSLKEREKRYFCHHCGKGFGTPTDLIRHLKIHEGETGYTCKFCGMDFIVKESLHAHYKLHPECGACFKQRTTLSNHMKIHTQEMNFVCMECGRKFLRKSGLQMHVLSHTGEKPNHCAQCDRSFTLKKSLVIHLRTHTGSKPYKCSTCEKCFRDKSEEECSDDNYIFGESSDSDGDDMAKSTKKISNEKIIRIKYL